MASLNIPESITEIKSSIVIDVSTILVATITFVHFYLISLYFLGNESQETIFSSSELYPAITIGITIRLTFSFYWMY